MDWTSLILALAIALYGLLEYRKRERLQKERIEAIRKGILPPFEPPPPQFWRVLTTGAVEVALIGLNGWIWYRALIGGGYFGAYAALGIFFTAMALVVLVMLVNQITRMMKKA